VHLRDSQVDGNRAGSLLHTEVKVTVLVKREIIAVMPLPSHPGHWLLTGRTEGEFGTWHVIRKPNGTYRVAVMPNCSARQPMLVELGDKITDASALSQFEASFVKLQQNVDRALVTPCPAA